MTPARYLMLSLQFNLLVPDLNVMRRTVRSGTSLPLLGA
jgi:hypothetical protein